MHANLRSFSRTAWALTLLATAVAVGVTMSSPAPAQTSSAPAPGQLDPTFGTDGVVATPVGQNVRAYGLVRQSDGTLVVAGGAWSFGAVDIVLVGHSAAGSLDPIFGANGVVATDLGGFDYLTALVVQPDDKLVAAARSSSGGSEQLRLVRYQPDGTLDASFGSNGVVVTPIDGNAGLPYGLALQPDGKIVAAGPRGASGVDLVRYTAAGALDEAFGSDGAVTTPLRGSASWHGIVVQPDGKIVVKANTGIGVELARYNPNGTIDTSFGTAGHVMLMRPFSATSLVLQPDGKLVMAGLWSCGIVCDFGLARLSPTGALDSTFGVNGIVTTDLGAQEYPYALALQPDGKLVAAGGRRLAFPGNSDFVLVRYTAAGARDAGFGTNGLVTIDTGGDDVAMALALEPGGTIVAGGEGNAESPFAPTHFVVARFLGGDPAAPPNGGGGGGGGQPADLELSKAASVQTAAVGDTVLYRLQVRVKNATQTSGATQVVVTDPLPAGLELVSTKANRGPGCIGTTTLMCNLDFLSGQLVGEIEILARVTRSGTLVNTATLTAAEQDPDPSNNTASATVAVPEQEPDEENSATTGVVKTGSAGNDLLRGTPYADRLFGLAGNDRLFGLAGADALFGGAGRDTLYGQAGNDTLHGGLGPDLLDAGSGGDMLRARDGTRDVVRCGPGRDTVQADRRDRVARDCELVRRPAARR